MPKVDLDKIEQLNRTGYPPPFNQEVAGRWVRRLAPAAGLTELGVSHVTLKPGAWSSQRHWHNGEDEFLVMLHGEAVLVEDEGRTLLRAGDCAAWPKGNTNGHHVRNESDSDCTFLCMSAGRNAGGGYSDIDMMWTVADGFVRKDGTPYGTRPASEKA
jgi:uncharacterized cupin superfamily protein